MTSSKYTPPAGRCARNSMKRRPGSRVSSKVVSIGVGEEHAVSSAISINRGDDGEPHIQIRGKDRKVRAGLSDHDCVRIIANKDLSALRVTPPNSEDTAFLTSLQGADDIEDDDASL